PTLPISRIAPGHTRGDVFAAPDPSRLVEVLHAEDQLPGVEDAPEQAEHPDAADDIQGVRLADEDPDPRGESDDEEPEAGNELPHRDLAVVADPRRAQSAACRRAERQHRR